MNSDSVEAILNDLISIVPTRFENKMDLVRIKAEAKAALDKYYAQKHAAEVLELALEVCKNQPITFNRLERAVKEHFNG